jgi:hypothetical protein
MFADVSGLVFPGVGAIAVFSFLAVASWSDARRREREAYYRSETIKRIAEAQGAGAAAALELLRAEDKIAAGHRREGIRLGGLVTTFVGIAVMVLLLGLELEEPVYLAGLVPLAVGAALLIYSYFLAPKE